LADAQNSLSANIIELRQSGAAMDIVSQGEIQLASLVNLMRQVQTATPAGIASMRGDIAACVAAATKIAQQAQTAASGASQVGGSLSLAAAREASRAAVASFADDYYEKKLFDPYLRFSSPEDEQKYRRKEAERKDEIERARALQTPEGDLLANKLSTEQLKDAGAHGATASPDFQGLAVKLAGSEKALSAELKKPSPQPSHQAQVASKLIDPLDAIKPSLDASREQIAKLKSAGVLLSDAGTGHGVTVNDTRQGVGQRSPT
jgi:hypothetical protein